MRIGARYAVAAFKRKQEEKYKQETVKKQEKSAGEKAFAGKYGAYKAAKKAFKNLRPEAFKKK